MKVDTRFKTVSQVSFWLTTAAMIGLVLLTLSFFAVPEFARSTLMDNARQGLNVSAPPSTVIVYGILLAGLLGGAVQLFVLWNMRALFSLYSHGELLSRACAFRISRIGFGLLLLPVAGILYQSVSSVLMTLGNAVGERELSIAISSGGIAAFLGGAMLLLVGVAMQEASRQAEENRAFV